MLIGAAPMRAAADDVGEHEHTAVPRHFKFECGICNKPIEAGLMKNEDESPGKLYTSFADAVKDACGMETAYLYIFSDDIKVDGDLVVGNAPYDKIKQIYFQQYYGFSEHKIEFTGGSLILRNGVNVTCADNCSEMSINSVKIEDGGKISTPGHIGILTVSDTSKMDLMCGSFDKIIIEEEGKTVNDIISKIMCKYRHTTEGSQWATAEEEKGAQISDVAVAERPFYQQKVKFEVNGRSFYDGEVKYGTASAATVFVYCPSFPAEISYKWYVNDDPFTYDVKEFGFDIENAGEYNFRCEMTSDGYTDSAYGTLTVNKISSYFSVYPKGKDIYYNGEEQKLFRKGSAVGGTLKYKLKDDPDDKWTEDVIKAKKAGSYTVLCKVFGDKNHSDYEDEIVCSIKPLSVNADNVELSQKEFVYNGKEQKPLVTVKKNGITLSENEDFTVECPKDSTSAGEKTLIIRGINNVTGEIQATYNIIAKSVTVPTILLDNDKFTYDGKEKRPAVTVRDGETVIPESEYTVSYSNNTAAGEATVTVADNADGDYIINGTKTFTIDKAEVTVKPKDVSKVYGSAAAAFELESGSPLIAESELDRLTKNAQFECDGADAAAQVKEGGYEITAKLADYESENLRYKTEKGTLTVTKAPLTVTVKDVTREYGAQNPTPEVEYSGFVNGDDKSVIKGEINFIFSVDENSPADVHKEAVTADGLTAANYEINYVKGNVTITKIPVAVTITAATRSKIEIVFDRAVEGLTTANFKVTDKDGREIALTNASTQDNLTYVIEGTFAVGEEHKVSVTLDGNAADSTLAVENNSVTAVPVRTSTGGSLAAPVYCTVKFETNGANAVDSIKIVKNRVISQPNNVKKDGYKLVGWFTDSELTDEYNFGEKVTKSITLYAKWEKIGGEDESQQGGTSDNQTGDTSDNQTGGKTWKNPFSDVKENDWFAGSVEYAVKNGLFRGISDDTFEPYGNITRGMFITVLYRADGEPAVFGENGFTDVLKNDYFSDAVLWGEQNGIINGISDTLFAPNENITREQIAVMMYRYAKLTDTAPTGAWAIRLDYSDLTEISDYAAEAVMFCKLKNVMQGKDGNRFAPKENATRAEIAAVLERFLTNNK